MFVEPDYAKLAEDYAQLINAVEAARALLHADFNFVSALLAKQNWTRAHEAAILGALRIAANVQAGNFAAPKSDYNEPASKKLMEAAAALKAIEAFIADDCPDDRAQEWGESSRAMLDRIRAAMGEIGK